MRRTVCEGFEQPLCGGHVVADVRTKASPPTGTHSCLCCLMEDQIDPLYHRTKLNVDQITFIEGDLVDIELGPVVQGIDLVFHQAAQAGVRASWGAGFSPYIRHNVTATQKLLEAFTHRPPRAFIYASSSSVYANNPLPIYYNAPPHPLP